MKKYLFFFILATAAIWAKDICQWPTPIEIYFTNSSMWYDKDSFLFGCPTIVADTVSDILADGYKCNKEDQITRTEKAFLDSSMFLFRDKREGVSVLSIYNAFDMISSEDETHHSVGEIFKDEFLHWQQCGILSLSYEKADSLAKLLEASINDFVKNRDSEIVNDFFIVTESPHSTPKQIGEWIEEFCETKNLEHSSELVNLCDNLEAAPAWLIEACSSTSTPNSSNASSVSSGKEQDVQESLFSTQKHLNGRIFIRNHEVHISKSLLGKAYAVFDINGKVIQKGIAGEVIRMPISPSILKIGAQKPILCK